MYALADLISIVFCFFVMTAWDEVSIISQLLRDNQYHRPTLANFVLGFVIFHLWINTAICWQYDWIYRIIPNAISRIISSVDSTVTTDQFATVCDFSFSLVWQLTLVENNPNHSSEKHACWISLMVLLSLRCWNQIWGKKYHPIVWELLWLVNDINTPYGKVIKNINDLTLC